MAGVVRDGDRVKIKTEGFPFLRGVTRGRNPFGQWNSGVSGGPAPVLLPVPIQVKGPRIDIVQPIVPKVPVIRAGNLEDAASPFQDWFEHVHILPRQKVEFGNIVTLVTNEFEIYSAFRSQSVTLQAVQNNAAPGVELPDVAPPVVMPPQTSILSPTSSPNDAGTGLGTVVRTTVNATANGLPIFDTNILFDFNDPANDVELLVSGSRIVLIPFEYERPLRERLLWFGTAIPGLDGSEQRISSGPDNPRQFFEPVYLLEGNDRQRMQALLFDWSTNVFGFPLWKEALRITAATAPGATQYSVVGGDEPDLRIGGLAAVIGDTVTFDVINIASISPTLIEASDPAINGYPVGTRLMPLRTAFITREQRSSRPPVSMESFQLTFEVTDNDTGAIVPSITPGFWSLFEGRVLFDDCNFIPGNMEAEYLRKLYRFDNETGLIEQLSIWNRNKRRQRKGFSLRGRPALREFRGLLSAFRGIQKSFWIPTFIEDLTAAADLQIGISTIDVESINYVRFVRQRLPMSRFRITFTDATTLVRTVTDSATVSATVERLTLDTPWPANRTVAEIARIEFYELTRLDTNEVTITHDHATKATCIVPLIRVFDLN